MRVDSDTFIRLKTLANGAPLSRYVRELSIVLADGVPRDAPELNGGLSTVPIHRRLARIEAKLDELATVLKSHQDWLRDLQKHVFGAAVCTGMIAKALDQSGLIPGFADMMEDQGRPQMEALFDDFLKRQGFEK